MDMNEIEQIKNIKSFALQVRKNILEMAVSAGAGSAHFGGALSITEIVSTLFAYQMKIDKKNPNWEERDRFIRGLRAWVGFNQIGIPYTRPERKFGKTTNSFFKNIVNFCIKKKAKLIHLSSTSVYGEQKGIVDESCKKLRPKSPYAERKIKEEDILKKNREKKKEKKEK